MLELAWNPGPGSDASLAAELLAVGVPKASQLWPPIGSVVLVAPGAGAHPGVQPAVDTVREQWPAAVVTVVDETVAALLGADPEPAACVVVHQDAVHTSVALVAGREVIASGLATGGVRGLAEAVIGHVRDGHRLDLGLETAWSAVVHGGAFAPSPKVPVPMSVHGSLITDDTPGPRQPVEVALSPTELRAVVAPAYQPVVDLVARVLRDAPPETARRATAGGLLLTGPHPPGAEDHLTGLTELPARRVAEPKSGFEHPQILRDGVARLLAENPPTPVIDQERTERFRQVIADWASSSVADDDAYTPEELALLEALRLLPGRPNTGDR
ncbi:rod shape-determining protein [Streptomyces sp. STR69]|uniref:rod shape-determining protein n=1 Tax=Streptomyces sp. STR69 TaxID=1796942 RepID=UPI0021C94C16|nr:rod shape-determining protein [Streptomyces sp. STR69]